MELICEREDLRVLLIGEDREGDLMDIYRDALEAWGHSVTCFDQGQVTMKKRGFVWRAANHFSHTPAALLINLKVRRFLRQTTGPIDFALICDSKYIFPQTLNQIKAQLGCRVFTWQTADLDSRTLCSKFALRSMPYYDCVFAHTPNDLLVAKRLGAPRVEYLPLGCNPNLLRRLDTRSSSAEDGDDVVFIGHWRSERQRILEQLVKLGTDYKLTVWGYGWRNGRPPDSSALMNHVKMSPLSWNEMADRIHQAKITLVFLSYFDTGRVVAPLRIFEIAAAGGFMLVEKGSGQAHEFFTEGKEMASFDGPEDLRNKITYYLQHPHERRKMQKAAQDRLIRDGYFGSDRLERVLDVYRELTPNEVHAG